ncbi:MAG: hypothetical protein DME22_02920 [Verrucomicrobia bacterium]|nr:MAG: hypothetical protein DME22_02920 [Verrucomicrobiota bacterium]
MPSGAEVVSRISQGPKVNAGNGRFISARHRIRERPPTEVAVERRKEGDSFDCSGGLRICLTAADTPELDQELARARAGLAQAEAGLALAKTTAARWSELLKTASVSEQETAEKQADLALKSATVEAARANVRRLEELKSFASVTAPFAGTIIARRTDVGQLITAGSSRELFRLAQTRTLRVYVRVPQTLSRAVESGQRAELTLTEFPGRKFEAKIVRSFTETGPEAALTLPSNTLLFRAEGMQVGLVNADEQVELRRVTLGRDFGQVVEVLEGVGPTDRVILNPSDSLTAGATVRIGATPKTLAAK